MKYNFEVWRLIFYKIFFYSSLFCCCWYSCWRSLLGFWPTGIIKRQASSSSLYCVWFHYIWFNISSWRSLYALIILLIFNSAGLHFMFCCFVFLENFWISLSLKKHLVRRQISFRVLLLNGNLHKSMLKQCFIHEFLTLNQWFCYLWFKNKYKGCSKKAQSRSQVMFSLFLFNKFSMKCYSVYCCKLGE